MSDLIKRITNLPPEKRALLELQLKKRQRTDSQTANERAARERVAAEADPQPTPAHACIHNQFEAQAARRPYAVAISTGGNDLSFAEVNGRANRLAHYLRSIGVLTESPVGIRAEEASQTVTALLAVLKAGGSFVILERPGGRGRSYLRDDMPIAAILTEGGPAVGLSEYAGAVITLDADTGLIDRQSDREPDAAVLADNLACVILGEGPADEAPAVMVSHRSLASLFMSMDCLSGVSDDERLIVQSGSPPVALALQYLWALTRGRTLLIRQDRVEDNPREGARQGRAARGMQFSLFYFSSDESVESRDKYRLVFEGAKFADRHNFTAIWTPERHFHAFGGLYPNPSVLTAALAVMTERVRLRAGSVVLPLHHPVRVAEEWSVVDNISNGRVGIAFASGWHANDFIFSPQNYAERRDVTLRDIEVVRRLWRGEGVKAANPVGDQVEVRIFPRPVQPELPIWITAAGTPDTYDRAGLIGANVLTNLLGQSVEGTSERIRLYRDSLERHGNDPDAGHVTLMLHTYIGTDVAEVRRKVRAPFCNYIKSFTGLLESLAGTLKLGVKRESFSAEDMDALLSHAFDRYFTTSALFGTPDTCMEMIDSLKQIGVDEVACLIDFGVDVDSTLAGLRNLNDLKERCNRAAQPAAEAFGREQQCKGRLSGPGYSAMRNLLSQPEAPWMLAPSRARIDLSNPPAGGAVYLLDDYLRPVRAGMTGEIYVGGDPLARGYLDRADLTAERFIPSPFASEPGMRIYKTGHKARFKIDGYAEILSES